jgi:hypothetical protein
VQQEKGRQSCPENNSARRYQPHRHQYVARVGRALVCTLHRRIAGPCGPRAESDVAPHQMTVAEWAYSHGMAVRGPRRANARSRFIPMKSETMWWASSGSSVQNLSIMPVIDLSLGAIRWVKAYRTLSASGF